MTLDETLDQVPHKVEVAVLVLVEGYSISFESHVSKLPGVHGRHVDGPGDKAKPPFLLLYRAVVQGHYRVKQVNTSLTLVVFADQVGSVDEDLSTGLLPVPFRVSLLRLVTISFSLLGHVMNITSHVESLVVPLASLVPRFGSRTVETSKTSSLRLKDFPPRSSSCPLSWKGCCYILCPRKFL